MGVFNTVETFWDILYQYTDSEIEETEIYEDFDDARADFIHMTQDHPEKFEYVVLREITTNKIDYEDIQVIDCWYGE